MTTVLTVQERFQRNESSETCPASVLHIGPCNMLAGARFGSDKQQRAIALACLGKTFDLNELEGEEALLLPQRYRWSSSPSSSLLSDLNHDTSQLN